VTSTRRGLDKQPFFRKSPVVASGGNRSQIAQPKERPNQAKTVAVGCDQLPKQAHAKEGVDGSSPSEGLDESPGNGAFFVPEVRRGMGENGQCASFAAVAPLGHDSKGHLDAAPAADRRVISGSPVGAVARQLASLNSRSAQSGQ
jgi:hypothetical protein